MTTKPKVNLIDKKTGKRIKAEDFLPLVFKKVRQEKGNAFSDLKDTLSPQLLDDLIFSMVTANYKELYKKFGEGFKLGFDAYKHGRGKKQRVEIAKYIKKKQIEQKQKDLSKRIDQMLKANKVDNPNPQPDNPYMMFHEGEWIDNSPSALAERIKADRDEMVNKV